MSFDGIRVDHAVLDTASVDLARAGHRMRARLDQLDADLRPLASQWAGSAQQSYAAARTAWTTAMDEMVVLLGQVSEAVAASNQAYRETDVRGARRFQ